MSCETELQELLHQIDIMVNHRRQEWEVQKQELQTRLQTREMQLINCRMQAIELQLVRNLQQQVEETERVQRETVCGYEDQLASLHSELEKLKDSYGSLQGLFKKEETQAAQEKDSSFESSTLSWKLEELQMKSREWEKLRSLHQKDLAALEVNRKLLAAKCQLFQQLKSGCYQSPLAGELHVEMQNEVTELQTQPQAVQEVAQVDEAMVGLEEVFTPWRDTQVNKGCFLPEELHQESLDEVCKLRAELQARDDLFQATQLEGKHWKREAARLREELSAQEIATRLEVEKKESVLAAELLELRENVEGVQQQLESSIQQEKLLREDIIQLQIGLESSNSHTKQLRDALSKKEEKLHNFEQAGKCKDNEIALLKKTLVQQQAERSKMQAMKAETQHLRAQLKDSESTLASVNQKAARVQRELLSITGKATEYQVAKIQLEALKLENKNLKQLFSEMESNTSLMLNPLGDPLADHIIIDASSDSGQWEETSCSTEDPYGIFSHVNPQPASWEQTEATCYPLAQSPTPKPEDCYYPHGNSHREEDFTAKVDRTKNTLAPLEPSFLKSPSPVFNMGEQFLQQEEQRMKRLEQHFDSYIQELHSNTQRMLLKYGISHPEGCRSS